jgi:hypothetical protein
MKLKGFILGTLAAIVVAVLFAHVAIQTGVVPANSDEGPFWIERAAAMSLHEGRSSLVRQS